jgi:threonine/homoserine/homoserine lactone efflux protein
MTMSLGLFLLSAAGISLSGVMAPGPLTATTITKGYHNPHAGLMVSIGHAIVELPIMALIYFGFASYLASPDIKKIIGVLGGIVLIYMGAMILKDIRKDLDEMSKTKYGPLVAGIVMTGGNPYFLLWWATIGIALILGAAEFGIFGLIIFAIVHWSCDAVWQEFVSITVHRTKHLWTKTVRFVIFGICSAVLIGFGIWYCISVFLN